MPPELLEELDIIGNLFFKCDTAIIHYTDEQSRQPSEDCRHGRGKVGSRTGNEEIT